MQANKKFFNKCSENSRSQIVFRTDIFRKLSLGAPVYVKEKGSSPVRKNTLFRVRVVVTVSFRKRNHDKGDNGDEEFR